MRAALVAILRTILVGLSLLISTATAQIPQNDFDGDGASDLLTVTASGSSFRWTSRPSTSGGTSVDQQFGTTGDLAIPGYWLSSIDPSLAIIRQNKKTNVLEWKVLLGDGTLKSHTLGRPGDYIITSTDFDGNDIADGAIMRIRGRKFNWTVALDMFLSDKPSLKKFRLGALGDRICMVSVDGGPRWAAAFGLDPKKRRAILTTRSLVTKEKKRFTHFPKRLGQGDRPRPIPIRGSDGIDALVFVTTDGVDTTIEVFNLQGTRIKRYDLASTGDVAIGDFDIAQDGEEIVYQTSSTARLLNPFQDSSSTKDPLAGTLADGTLLDETVAAATPTPSPTATPS